MSVALAMFRKSNKDGDIKKAAQKVADPKKDTLTRLKHLRTVLENYEVSEAKTFFKDNYSHIYYIFFDNFVTVEADLKQRANKSHREELDNILHIFEKILLFLPELVHKRWMFHSIGRIMKKLLHPGNGLKLRRDGLRLFLIWYQILQENASEECHKIFLQLVPGLGDGIHQDILNCRTASTPDSYGGIIAAGEVTPILPVAGEKQPDNITKFFFDALLQFIVSEVVKIEWENKEMRETCFMFLFNKMKNSYLTWLLPNFDKHRTIYEPLLDLPTARTSQDTISVDEPENVSECRDSFIRWITTFTITSAKKVDSEMMKGISCSALEEKTENSDETKPGDDSKGDSVDNATPSSNTSTLSTTSLQCTEKDSPNNSFTVEEHSASEYEIVRRVLYSTRENINIVHEIFRQALLFSCKHGTAIRRVIAVYKDWFQHESEKPIFLLEPSETGFPLGMSLGEALSQSLSDILEEEMDSASEESGPASIPLQLSRDSGDFKNWLRNASYLGAIQDLADGGDYSQIDVRAGQQKLLQIFTTNAANIFLLEAGNEEGLTEQVDLCKRVLNIYRHMVMKISMDQKTWEQLLKVLLCITSGVLSHQPPDEKGTSLGGRLAQPIFQTLIVTWIKGNLQVYINSDLWDEFLQVLSSLTSWAELIKEWAKTMDTLMRVLARQVYNLDLLDLPLQRLSEQKEKRRRGKSQDIPKSKLDDQSFSRAWSKSEATAAGTAGHTGSFERQQTKYKSDGAGGGKTRPDLTKQRSLSGTPSPNHSRSASASSDLASMVRSSSEGNLPDPSEIAERLKQVPVHRTLPTAKSSVTRSLAQFVALATRGEQPLKLTAHSVGIPFSGPRQTVSLELHLDCLSGHLRMQHAMVSDNQTYLYSNDHMFSDRQVYTNSADSDQTAPRGALFAIPSASSGHITQSSPEPNAQRSKKSHHIAHLRRSSGKHQQKQSDASDKTENLSDSTESQESENEPGVVSNEDHEVSAVVSQSAEAVSPTDTHESMDISHASSYSSERSETDTITRRSRSPSPGSVQYRSRTPSPTHSTLLAEDLNCPHKDSLTPDRDSLHIDMVANHVDSQDRGSLEEFKSVLAGGACQGWLPDVSVVLWRRMLGALGDVNKIEDPAIHASVFEHLCDLQDTLQRMRDNLGVTLDNQSSPSPPEFIPPQRIFAGWLFECLTLSNKYKRGKLLAYQLLCQMMVRQPDVSIPVELLAQFYQVLQQGLNSQDQDVKNVLVRYCSTKFFATLLPGNSLLIVSFLHALESIVSSTDMKETPRLEALSFLGSLTCFPNHYKDIPTLHSDLERHTMSTEAFKDHLMSLLLKAGKKEPAGLARCIAVNSIGIFLYEELSHGILESKYVEAVNVLLGTLRCNEKRVAKLSADMLTLLCDHVDKLLDFHPGLPKRIVEIISATIVILIPERDSTVPDSDRKLLMSMMACVVEWCLKIPVHSMLETSESDKGCLFNVFQMLNIAVSGHTPTSMYSAAKTLSDLWHDQDFENLRDIPPLSRPPSSDSLSSMADKPKRPSPENKKKTETDSVKLAARLYMNHLVNYLCHFPMGIGATRLSTSVAENSDQVEYGLDDLKSDIFAAPNVQFFVLNQRTLISFIELPALVDVPGGGMTAGLTTAKTVCRVILRDLTGKYCWESSVLYGPPWCPKGSYFENARALHGLSKDAELEPLIIQEDSDLQRQTAELILQPRNVSDLPVFETTGEHHDNLNDLLGYIGHTSPECLLIPGVPLNLEAPIPEDLNEHAETMMKDMVLHQKEAELEYYNKHKNDASMLAKPQMPMDIQDPISPFQMCRMLLDQMGLLSWEKRSYFDLLKKSDKLLRELKNLDAQKCRETHKFAVIYVAEGQEDKNSILSNPGGSKAFEDFVTGLGWEVDLESHKGFLGGLQQNKSTGDTAPYYADSTCEILFHVSTRIPSGSTESMHIKMRHLGNDEVHIVWSEHTRDYRRGIIPTDFGDVLIIIYPLPSGLYRIHIDKKPEIQLFGPLFNGAIVDYRVLPGLVRATAINASRVIRSQKQFFHTYFQERAKCLDQVMQQHVEQTMFEDFAAEVYAPVLPPNSAISDSASDTSIATSLSQGEISKQTSEAQVSPSTTRQSRASETSLHAHERSTLPTITETNVFSRTARRLSRRKSSSARGHPTPPSSPKVS